MQEKQNNYDTGSCNVHGKMVNINLTILVSQTCWFLYRIAISHAQVSSAQPFGAKLRYRKSRSVAPAVQIEVPDQRGDHHTRRLLVSQKGITKRTEIGILVPANRGEYQRESDINAMGTWTIWVCSWPFCYDVNSQPDEKVPSTTGAMKLSSTTRLRQWRL